MEELDVTIENDYVSVFGENSDGSMITIQGIPHDTLMEIIMEVNELINNNTTLVNYELKRRNFECPMSKETLGLVMSLNWENEEITISSNVSDDNFVTLRYFQDFELEGVPLIGWVMATVEVDELKG